MRKIIVLQKPVIIANEMFIATMHIIVLYMGITIVMTSIEPIGNLQILVHEQETY